jgi:hypothetical protein
MAAYENPLADENSINRTGIMTHPESSAELILGAEESNPGGTELEDELAARRAEYVSEALPIGSNPLPGKAVEGDEAQLQTEADGTTVLLDKMGERLAFERQGTRLYKSFLEKCQASVTGDNEPTIEDVRHICDEELEHFKMLQQAVGALGGDATVETPSADVAGVISHGIMQVISDPRTTIAQCLQALLSAELADNDGWELLGKLAAALGHSELKEQCQQALNEEQEHLEKVRGWLLSVTMADAQIGDSESADERLHLSQMDGESESASAAEVNEIESDQAGQTDALELLAEDHQTVKDLFEQAEAAGDDKEKKRIFREIKKQLDTHSRIEETIFYPAMQEHEELKDMVLESLEEHRQVKKMLRDMDKLGKNSEMFEPKLKVLQENVEHHAEEEEEGKMFPKVRELLSAGELSELGEELQSAKKNRRPKRKKS